MSVATMEAQRDAWGESFCGRRGTSARRQRRGRKAQSQWLAPIAGGLVLLSFMALVGILPTSAELAATRTAAASQVRVTENDTLWSIARQHAIPGATTEQTVDAIMRLNGLHGASVHAGTLLRVPAADTGTTAFAQAGDPSSLD